MDQHQPPPGGYAPYGTPAASPFGTPPSVSTSRAGDELRSPAQRVVGWFVTLALSVGWAFVLAWLATWVVGIVHDWWPFVPVLPYGVAVKVVFVIALGVVISAVFSTLGKWAISKKRRSYLDD
ncbi:hypothetical protein [Amycolatopsis sp. NPDC051903]|uniref:hypothetical protein n=1 Tax=Amycolatopsis sp. NPDC051903 TaxID=3363936 RepID=UPI0037ACD5DC